MLHIVLTLRCLFRRACSVLLWMADWVLYRCVVAIVFVGLTDRGALVDGLALGAACLRVRDVG